MRALFAIGMLAAVVATAGCGGADEAGKKDEPMKVEDTAFGPLIGTQDKARDRANAAVDTHRENLNQRLEQDEGGNRAEQPVED
jgi:ABC-type glycerol-3-phosphate transport system substrate-binding protein